MPDDPLKAVLLDILYELRQANLPLLVGGGYGLFLKQEHLASSGQTRTLFPMETWPEARSTNDIDVLLRPEIVTHSEHMGEIRAALERLEFEPVLGAEYMQFLKRVGGTRFVKIDFLAGPLGPFLDPAKVKVDDRRIRPRPSVKLHAHRMDEAVVYERHPIVLRVSGRRSGGEAFEADVSIPQGFTYALMKLHAFYDRKEDPMKDMAQYHALDLYRILAMLTLDEYRVGRRLAEDNREEPAVQRARWIVGEFFSGLEALGVLRMREHPLFSTRMNVSGFLEMLVELFPPP